MANFGQKFTSFVFDVLRGLDQMFLGGAVANTTDVFNQVDKKLTGTSDEKAAANSLRDLIDKAFAAEEANDSLRLQKIMKKIEDVSAPIMTSVPGLQEKVNALRNAYEREYADTQLKNVQKQVKRDAATAAADAYASLTDEERAKANDPNSRAGKYIADFDKKRKEAMADIIQGPPAPPNLKLVDQPVNK